MRATSAPPFLSEAWRQRRVGPDQVRLEVSRHLLRDGDPHHAGRRRCCGGDAEGRAAGGEHPGGHGAVDLYRSAGAEHAEPGDLLQRARDLQQRVRHPGHGEHDAAGHHHHQDLLPARHRHLARSDPGDLGHQRHTRPAAAGDPAAGDPALLRLLGAGDPDRRHLGGGKPGLGIQLRALPPARDAADHARLDHAAALWRRAGAGDDRPRPARAGGVRADADAGADPGQRRDPDPAVRPRQVRPDPVRHAHEHAAGPDRPSSTASRSRW